LAADGIHTGMELTVKPIGSGVQFEAEARGHKVICDQPRENGGDDTGMTPPELLLASLGTCSAYYALQYLKSRSLPTKDLAIKVSAGKAQQPARMTDFRIDVDIPAGLDERHRDGIKRAIEKCLIHNTLLHSPTVEVALHMLEPAMNG
jgi:putative redox protein